MPSQSLLNAAERVMALAKEKRLTLVTAESCTSGLLAAVLSEAPGAAELLHGGFVTYTKCHKTIALGVPRSIADPQRSGLPGGRHCNGGGRAGAFRGRSRHGHHRCRRPLA